MVSLSVPNIITIGFIAILAVGVAKFGLNAVGWNTAWL